VRCPGRQTSSFSFPWELVFPLSCAAGYAPSWEIFSPFQTVLPLPAFSSLFRRTPLLVRVAPSSLRLSVPPHQMKCLLFFCILERTRIFPHASFAPPRHGTSSKNPFPGFSSYIFLSFLFQFFFFCSLSKHSKVVNRLLWPPPPPLPIGNWCEGVLHSSIPISPPPSPVLLSPSCPLFRC